MPEPVQCRCLWDAGAGVEAGEGGKPVPVGCQDGSDAGACTSGIPVPVPVGCQCWYDAGAGGMPVLMGRSGAGPDAAGAVAGGAGRQQEEQREHGGGRAGRRVRSPGGAAAVPGSAAPRHVGAGAGGHPHVHEALPGRDRRGAAARARLPAVAAVRRGAEPRRAGQDVQERGERVLQGEGLRESAGRLLGGAAEAVRGRRAGRGAAHQPGGRTFPLGYHHPTNREDVLALLMLLCVLLQGGNYRSALNDAIQAKKLKPTHLKAIIRGALCHMELKNFVEAIAWCEEGLEIDSKEKKLVEMRAKADKLKRTQERDARKAKVLESKEQCQKEMLLAAIKERNIKLVLEPSDEEEEVSDGLAEISLDGFHSGSATGAKVHLDADGSLSWPVLFLYPEHEQTDFTVAFHESSRFIDHLMVMFAELPPWDLEKKYLPNNLELYFEDEEREEMYEVNPEHTLLQVLQHERYFVKAGTPTVLVFARRSPFSKKYFSGKKVHRL
ncbi:tetratricopeptide repeat protein 4 isoform X1 [Haemorhous mexicanus]|uniref:tetratricopeptide repeat protein 4 isoform X1 n=1 Tax=Haemorhous mexicanus TaxID=30427 RepID=UPI0028BD3618|nr:tetratricopeptide repeat protein 4 isoform X1 [Haemorhous mexicanus]